jgi:acyl carrier protein
MSVAVDCTKQEGYTGSTDSFITKGEAIVDIFERVKKIIVDQLGVDPAKIVTEARFREDLGADSLDLVELIMGFEEEFGGTISDDEAQGIKTVGEAVKYLETRSA